jgi:hypothetical protein
VWGGNGGFRDKMAELPKDEPKVGRPFCFSQEGMAKKNLIMKVRI